MGRRRVEADDETCSRLQGDAASTLGGGPFSFSLLPAPGRGGGVSEAFADPVPFVIDAEACLPLEGYAPEAKLDDERVLVDRLGIFGSEVPVHLEGRLDHAPREDVRLVRRLPELLVAPERMALSEEPSIGTAETSTVAPSPPRP